MQASGALCSELKILRHKHIHATMLKRSFNERIVCEMLLFMVAFLCFVSHRLPQGERVLFPACRKETYTCVPHRLPHLPFRSQGLRCQQPMDQLCFDSTSDKKCRGLHPDSTTSRPGGIQTPSEDRTFVLPGVLHLTWGRSKAAGLKTN